MCSSEQWMQPIIDPSPVIKLDPGTNRGKDTTIRGNQSVISQVISISSMDNLDNYAPLTVAWIFKVSILRIHFQTICCQISINNCLQDWNSELVYVLNVSKHVPDKFKKVRCWHLVEPCSSCVAVDSFFFLRKMTISGKNRPPKGSFLGHFCPSVPMSIFFLGGGCRGSG